MITRMATVRGNLRQSSELSELLEDSSISCHRRGRLKNASGKEGGAKYDLQVRAIAL